MFDSFAAGLPIIHNTSGWIAELVSQNNCGITVKPRNSQEMADAMIKMLDNDVFRNEAKKSAVLLSKGVYNYDTMSNKYLVEMNNMFI
jgi:glycosyltransferase involved in cell wall biosynthesis